jgi:hypothetical protein
MVFNGKKAWIGIKDNPKYIMGTANCISATQSHMNSAEQQQEGKSRLSFLAAHGLSGSIGMLHSETVCEQ